MLEALRTLTTGDRRRYFASGTGKGTMRIVISLSIGRFFIVIT
jgi:hypothetical protein